MVLLSQTQVSAAISATIVILCTLALFVSGLVLQQKSVRDIQAAYRPRLARQVESATASILMSRNAESTALPIVEFAFDMTNGQGQDLQQITFDIACASLLEPDHELQLQPKAIEEELRALQKTNDVQTQAKQDLQSAEINDL